MLRLAGLEETIRFWDSSGQRMPGNWLPYAGLVGVTLHGKYANLLPRTAHFKDTPRKMLSFSAWWNQDILDDRRGHVFSRKALVAAMTRFEKDPNLVTYADETYLSLTKSNFLGWSKTKDGLVSAAVDPQTGNRVEAHRDGEQIGRADLISLRVIAEKFVYSIVNSYH
ncbi:MAG: hypothetical protein HYW49_09655 [Deltaproteobacteria bacterium]|nr:hypothetical protein [Deltaproteobacteria bacterium]